MKISRKIYIDKKGGKFFLCHIFSYDEEMYLWNRKDGYISKGRDRYLGLARFYKTLIVPSKKERKNGKRTK
jgi:hypothetical protein